MIDFNDPIFGLDALLAQPAFEEPKKKSAPRPSAGQTAAQSSALKRRWTPRNKRMRDDQELYELRVVDRVDGKDEEYAAETLIDNGPYTIVEKLVQILSGTEPRTTVPVRDEAEGEAAQKVENFLRWWRSEADRRWRRGLNHPLSYDEAKYLVLRGWICGRVTLNPDDERYPWRYRLFDPMNVYPIIGADGIKTVYHIYRATVEDILADYPEAEPFFKEKSPSGEVDLTSQWEVTSVWNEAWHIVLVDGQEVFASEHEYGFCPWVITIAQGAPYAQTPLAQRDYLKRRGVGALEGLREVYKYKSRLLSALATEVAKGPNPPIVVYTDEEGVSSGKQIDSGIGGNSTLLYDREKFEVVKTGFNPADFAALVGSIQEQISRAGLPDLAWGGGTEHMAGWAISLATASATDVLNSYKMAIQLHRETVFYYVLKLFSEHIPDSQPIKMIVTDKKGVRRQAVEIVASEVEAVGYEAEVRYGRIEARGERIALINAAAQLWTAKMIDLETALGDEFIGLEDPGSVKRKVLADLVYMNDDWLKKYAIPEALKRLNPEALDTYLATVAAEQPQPQAPQQPVPPELPPNALPPEMGVNAGLEPGAVAPAGVTDVQGEGDALIQMILSGLQPPV